MNDFAPGVKSFTDETALAKGFGAAVDGAGID